MRKRKRERERERGRERMRGREKWAERIFKYIIPKNFPI
jgi:hypothetical protein